MSYSEGINRIYPLRIVCPMKITEVEATPIRVPFRRAFELSRGVAGSPAAPGEHVYVKLVTSKGLVGWGEARPAHTWMYETTETVCSTIEGYLSPIVKRIDPGRRLDYERLVERELGAAVTKGQPLAKSAVEMAIMDLTGKEIGKPVHWLLGGKGADCVDIAYVISSSEESVEDEVRSGVSDGFKLFKVKIHGDPEHDAALLHQVSNAAPHCALCADANQAYDAFGFGKLLTRISDIPNLSFIEQPLETDDRRGQRSISRISRIPLALDESVYTARDLLGFIEARSLDAVVMKVAKSGFAESGRIVALARAAGLAVLGSGMTESGVGLAAAAHLFSTAGLQAPADLNGPQFLSNLLVHDLRLEKAKVIVPDGPGLGVTVDENKLREFSVKRSAA